MIIGLTLMIICSFLLAVGWWGECNKTQSLEEKMTSTESELVALKQSFKALLEEDEQTGDLGHHFKWRQLNKPTSRTYQIHFDIEPNGQQILEELTSRFKRSVFTDNERETCRRLGRAEVVDFIINRINTANDPRYNEQLERAYMEQNQ